jgi:hypothetical protein
MNTSRPTMKRKHPENMRLKATYGAPLKEVIQPGPLHFAMIEKEALHNMDELMRQDLNAARLVIKMIKLLESGSNGVVVISKTSIQEMLDISRSTATRAIETLVQGNWVQRIRIGTTFAFAINKNVAWVGPIEQQRHAIFNATVVASRSEQSKEDLEEKRLRKIPVVRDNEHVLAIGEEPEPPVQTMLPEVEPPVARQKNVITTLPNYKPQNMIATNYGIKWK